MNDRMIDQQLQRFSSAVAHVSPDLLPVATPPTRQRFNRPVVAFVSAFAVVMLTVGLGALVVSSAGWFDNSNDLAIGADGFKGGTEGQWEYWEWMIADAVELRPGVVGVTQRGPAPRFDLSTMGDVQRLLSHAEFPDEPFAPFSGRSPVPPIAYIGALRGTGTQVLLYWSAAFSGDDMTSGSSGGEIALCIEDRDSSGEGGVACFGESDSTSEEILLSMSTDESGALDSKGQAVASLLPRGTSVVALRLADGRSFVQRPIGGVAVFEVSYTGTSFAGSVDALDENGDILAQVSFNIDTQLAPANPSPETPAAECAPTATSGDPLSNPDRRIEDIIEALTGERQTGDEDPVEDTIDDPNFGGVWGDFQGSVVVAVLDCSKVDANELVRIAGGADYLRLIEVPHTHKQVNAFRDGLVQKLSDLGVPGQIVINSTLNGRFIEVQVLDPEQLPSDFGNEIPDDAFTIVKVDSVDLRE